MTSTRPHEPYLTPTSFLIVDPSESLLGLLFPTPVRSMFTKERLRHLASRSTLHALPFLSFQFLVSRLPLQTTNLISEK